MDLQLQGKRTLIANAGGPPSGKFESFVDEAWQQAIALGADIAGRILPLRWGNVQGVLLREECA